MGSQLSPLRNSLVALRAAYTQAQVPVETIQVYAAALNDIDPAHAEAACVTLVKRSRFFPTIAEIRETVAETLLRLPTSADAWAVVEGSRPANPDLDYRLAHETLRTLGGPWALRTADKPHWFRAQYVKAYDELRHTELLRVIDNGTRSLAEVAA